MFTNYTQEQVDAMVSASEAALNFKPNRTYENESGWFEVEDLTPERASEVRPKHLHKSDIYWGCAGGNIYYFENLWNNPTLERKILQ